MATPRTYRGTAVQWTKPDWKPLLDTVGEEVTGDFMWMCELELSTRTRIHAYKHVDTRRYVHLDHKGRAYTYGYRDRYRVRPAADVLAAVFTPLPGLAGVTTQRISASWAAVARLHPGELTDDAAIAEMRRTFCNCDRLDWGL